MGTPVWVVIGDDGLNGPDLEGVFLEKPTPEQLVILGKGHRYGVQVFETRIHRKVS